MALFFLWDQQGILRGIAGLHVDDILAVRDEYFEAKIEEVNKAIGLGSVKKNKFVHCGKEYEKVMTGADKGQIHVSMKGFIHNMELVKIRVGRASQFAEPLDAKENHDYRGGCGSAQWVVSELLYFMQMPVKVRQRRQGHALVQELTKLNDLIKEIKTDENFVLRYRSLDLKNCGFLGVSDASLGGVDAFGDPCEDESKVVKT